MPHTFYKCPFCDKSFRDQYYCNHLLKKHQSNLFGDTEDGKINKAQLQRLSTRYESLHLKLPSGHIRPHICLGCNQGNSQIVRMTKHIGTTKCKVKHFERVASLLGELPVSETGGESLPSESIGKAFQLFWEKIKELSVVEEDDAPSTFLPPELLKIVAPFLETPKKEKPLVPTSVIKVEDEEERRRKKLDEEYQKEIEEIERLKLLPENQPKPVQIFTTPEPVFQEIPEITLESILSTPSPPPPFKGKKKPVFQAAPEPEPELQANPDFQDEPEITLESILAKSGFSAPPPKGKSAFPTRSFQTTNTKPRVDSPRYNIISSTR